jgi:hypothetical protein
VSDAFLEKARSFDPRRNEKPSASCARRRFTKTKPVIVDQRRLGLGLRDVAGAAGHRRATVIGTRSFGKARQTIIPLGPARARWLTTRATSRRPAADPGQGHLARH